MYICVSNPLSSSLLHTIQHLHFSIRHTNYRWVQVGAFFLVIHSLVSTLVYGYVPTQPYFFSNSKAYSKLPTPFNDSLRISPYFLQLIYALGATFDINTTLSTCGVFGNKSINSNLSNL